MEEPAWYIFRRTVNRNKSETIAKEFSKRYGLNYKDSLNFVVEIRQQIKEFNQPSKPRKNIENLAYEINKNVYSPCSSHQYNMQKKIIQFSYETEQLESWIHPLIKHLETIDNDEDKSHFELFTYKNRVIFKVDNVIKGNWSKDESSLVKGRVFVELLNALHNKRDEDWLMTVHASAISNGKKTILFSASAGSGKTTFAALLQAHGYHIISDDFVPIEKSTFRTYPLPIALSVKEGSMDLLSSHYPELNKNSVVKIDSKKSVRYLPADKQLMDLIFPVHEYVFIKYDKSVDLLLEKTEPVEALKKLFHEAWIPSDAENVELFLDNILNASFYNLTYSNNEKAIEAINQLFENDEK
jgi:hypothetical protein